MLIKELLEDRDYSPKAADISKEVEDNHDEVVTALSNVISPALANRIVDEIINKQIYLRYTAGINEVDESDWKNVIYAFYSKLSHPEYAKHEINKAMYS